MSKPPQSHREPKDSIKESAELIELSYKIKQTIKGRKAKGQASKAETVVKHP